VKRLVVTVLAVAVIALLIVGLTQIGGGGGAQQAAPSRAEVTAALRGSPPALAALHASANQLLGGGPGAFKARLESLRGHPVVVNKWASWCGPCRTEFRYFQRLSAQEGKAVAFIGVDSSDTPSAAKRFLAGHPVSYPSYSDHDLSVAAAFSGVEAFPTTAFYDSHGTLQYIHQGEYPSEAKLRADIARYAQLH
jgi:cytochrome c biogenesis protein CcmG, thiol:disulfide interchange protein DsbE